MIAKKEVLDGKDKRLEMIFNIGIFKDDEIDLLGCVADKHPALLKHPFLRTFNYIKGRALMHFSDLF